MLQNNVVMDPEKQPLLSDVRCTHLRPLTREEVLRARESSVWRRSQLVLVLVFWSTMAMFLSIIACLLMNSRCTSALSAPGVPPAHLTLAPLMAFAQEN